MSRLYMNPVLTSPLDSSNCFRICRLFQSALLTHNRSLMFRRMTLFLPLLAASCVSQGDAPELWEAEVEVTSEPAGAQVIWFNPGNVETGAGPVAIGTTPLTWEASRGLIGPVDSVELVFFKPGHGRTTLEVTVEELRGDAPVVATIPAFGSLELSSTPMATFEVHDAAGMSVSEGSYAPATVGELTPGTYTITSNRVGYQSYEATIEVGPGQEAAHAIALVEIEGPADGEPRMSVLPGAVDGMGTIEFYEALRGQSRNVANCIDRAMVEDPLAAGLVTVRLALNLPFGTVESAEIIETEIDDAEAIDCIQRRLRRVVYVAVGGEGDTGTADLTLRYHRIAQ